MSPSCIQRADSSSHTIVEDRPERRTTATGTRRRDRCLFEEAKRLLRVERCARCAGVASRPTCGPIRSDTGVRHLHHVVVDAGASFARNDRCAAREDDPRGERPVSRSECARLRRVRRNLIRGGRGSRERERGERVRVHRRSRPRQSCCPGGTPSIPRRAFTRLPDPPHDRIEHAPPLHTAVGVGALEPPDALGRRRGLLAHGVAVEVSGRSRFRARKSPVRGWL